MDKMINKVLYLLFVTLILGNSALSMLMIAGNKIGYLVVMVAFNVGLFAFILPLYCVESTSGKEIT